MRLAFASMLCKRTGDSTWDRPDGEGSELGALAHGHALKVMHGTDARDSIDNILLHVAIPGQCGELRFHHAMHRAYTKVIRLDGQSRAEQVFLSQMRHQPHLWLKLLVLNLTTYDRVMWLGLDTVPLNNLKFGFTCPTLDAEGPRLQQMAIRNTSHPGLGILGLETLARAPCIAANGNADTMLFQPDAALLERMVNDIVSPRGRRTFDGRAGYDQSYLQERFQLGRMSVVQLTAAGQVPHGSDDKPFVYHWTGGAKPWYNAYCQFASPNATLVMGPSDRAKWTHKLSIETRKSCPPTPLPSVFEYLWWQLLRDALSVHETPGSAEHGWSYGNADNVRAPSSRSHHLAITAPGPSSTWASMGTGILHSSSVADRVITDWGMLEPLIQYRDTRAASACSTWVKAFAGIGTWCRSV